MGVYNINKDLLVVEVAVVMVLKCIVCGKTKREVPSLFRFSVGNRNLSRKWQHRPGLGKTDIKKSSRVYECSDHFPRESWSSHLKGTYRKLRRYALPLNLSKRHSTKCYQRAGTQLEVNNCYCYKYQFSY